MDTCMFFQHHRMNDQPFFDQDLLPYSSLTFRMVQMPGGQFRMGSPEGDPDAYESEKPRHPVQLDGFWMAEMPVTQALWETVIGNNPSHFKGEQHPVETVSWFDAAVFCNALSKMTDRNPRYLTPKSQPYGWDGHKWGLSNEGIVLHDSKTNGYRMPTEAEWEYAARSPAEEREAGSRSDDSYRYSGSDLLDQVGWYAQNSGGETHEVGLLLPNAFGLYDMSGNVFEWCEDWLGNYTAADQKNPRGPAEGVSRVVRGGDWGYDPRRCRPAYRFYGRPGTRDFHLGFRLALSLQSVG